MRKISLGLILSAVVSTAGCSTTVVLDGSSDVGGAGGGSGSGNGSGAADPGEPDGEIPEELRDPRLDILLVVDNSIGMATAQSDFLYELDALVRALVAPPCLTPTGEVVPADGLCPEGSERPFARLRDVHLGVITSSLGDLTSGACSTMSDPDDRGHLITRARGGSDLPTYQNLGFLAFDPDGAMNPPGEDSIDTFLSNARELVLGAGELGCGYEMPLEAMTRFLVDPAPYASLASVDGHLEPAGVDDVVLAQRLTFLRDTSNLAVIVLSNENDCSVDLASQGFLVLEPGPFYRATSTCETSPDDPCCTSCALTDDPACDPGGSCSAGPNGSSRYSDNDDPANLACFDQKRRYGIDFLYPTERYVNALSALTIDPTSSTLAGSSPVQNPLFARGRTPDQIAYQAMVGVPWQDLAADPTDARSRVLTSSELDATGRWDWFTGPNRLDPFTRESVRKRAGVSPATGANVNASNPINGGDRTVDNSLQFACISPLEVPTPNGFACGDCGGTCDNPICDGDTQIAAGASPGTRELEVARGLGERGLVGSVCLDPSLGGAARSMVLRLKSILP